jgi:hypothetical protein
LYKEIQKQRELAEQRKTVRRSSSKVFPLVTAGASVDETARALSQQRPQENLNVASVVSGTPNIQSHNNSVSYASTVEGPKESKVSKILGDLTTQRVVILIIVLTFCLPLLDLQSYVDASYLSPYSVAVLADSHGKMTQTEFSKLCQKFCDSAKDDTYYPLISVAGPDCGPFTFGTPEEDLRVTETMVSEDRGYRVVFDVRNNTKLTAGLGIGRTVFLCILLAVGAILFSHDTTTLVLDPLESMIEKVNKLANDPMWFCLATDDDELGIYSFLGNRLRKLKNTKHNTWSL